MFYIDIYMQYEYQGVEIALSIYTLQTQSIYCGIDQRKPHHRTYCCLNMADDYIQPYQIMQTLGNSEECCDDFGAIYFIRNMSMKDGDNPINNCILNIDN